MTSRRNLLKLLAAGLSGVALSELGIRTAGAQTSSDRKLVIALAYGGWDTTWTLDPKPDADEVDMVPGDVQLFDQLPIWTHTGRPSVTQFFEQWSSRTAVINGISVESLAHEPCADVVLTGGFGEKRPDLGARVADRLGATRPLPYLALGAQAETDGLEAQAGRLGDTNQIMALATPGFGWPAPGETAADVGLALDGSEHQLVQQYLTQSAATMATEANSPRSQRMLADYNSSLMRAEALQAAALNGGLLADEELFQDVSAPWKHVAAALAEGLSQVALVQPSLFWDTHAYNASQSDAYEEFFGGLNLLMAELAAQQIVDDTVVLVLSEMGRTPKHNSQGGKDHWPWTSAMLIDSQLYGGYAIGQTDEWLRPAPIDLKSGVPDDNGELIHAEHVLATTAALLGIAGHDWYGREAIGALVG